MTPTPTLTTRRLVLKPIGLDDAPAIQALFPRWEIVRYLNPRVPWPYPEDGAVTFLRDVALPAVARGEQWIWAIRIKAGPEHMVGAISLMAGDLENRGFWLGLDWHGQGYMTEACLPVTDFWFNELQRPVLRVVKAVGNVGSRRVSDKQGMTLVGVEDWDFVSGRQAAEIWQLTRKSWHVARTRLADAIRSTRPEDP